MKKYEKKFNLKESNLREIIEQQIKKLRTKYKLR